MAPFGLPAGRGSGIRGFDERDGSGRVVLPHGASGKSLPLLPFTHLGAAQFLQPLLCCRLQAEPVGQGLFFFVCSLSGKLNQSPDGFENPHEVQPERGSCHAHSCALSAGWGCPAKCDFRGSLEGKPSPSLILSSEGLWCLCSGQNSREKGSSQSSGPGSRTS